MKQNSDYRAAWDNAHISADIATSKKWKKDEPHS